ncbi:MAG: ABC transporter permease [Clostridia bacterium]|nr:ABC transporter permease [Clostridia bacterium]
MTATVECKKLISLVGRNTKCYFKDKFLFFVSMITPLILLVLFATFLRNVYIDSFKSAFPEGFTVNNRVLEGITGAWLMSSILSVSSVTVAFCSNVVMINDKIDGNLNDFRVSPVKGVTISIAYFISNFFVTLIVMLCLMLIGHIYLAAVGWYIPATDALMIIVDIFCCTLFGTLLAGVVESFISSQGGLSAVSTLVSSMYGFICGAYMPFSQFSEGLRNVLCCLPGTYGVGIMRNHYMSGYLIALGDEGVPQEALNAIRENFDITIKVFGTEIPLGAMYGILLGACAVLLAAYVTVVILKNKRK